MRYEETDPALRAMVEDQEWRLNNLYWIEDKEGNLVRFRMKPAQRKFYHRMHYRNEILKARQLGLSTFVELLILDCCLFNRRWHAGIIDKSEKEAHKKLEKITLAYQLLDYVPDDPSDEDRALAQIGAEIKQEVPYLGKPKAGEVRWVNGSIVEAKATVRGGTLQFLHVSEMAYVSARMPQRAKEVKNGALNTVKAGMYIVKESTHEGGRSGDNYVMVRQAMANEAKAELSPLDYRFHFLNWLEDPEYTLDAKYWDIPPARDDKAGWAEREYLEGYFAQVEKFVGKLTSGQKAWYASQWRALGVGIRQEFPTTPDEAFDVMPEATIFGMEMEWLQSAGRVGVEFEPQRRRPVYVSWDLGLSDYTCLWLFQVGADGKFYALDFYAAKGEQVDHYVGVVRAWESKYALRVTRHLLPHDARHQQWQGLSVEGQLKEAGFTVKSLPVTSSLQTSLQACREVLMSCVFHERLLYNLKWKTEELPGGVRCLQNYAWQPESMKTGKQEPLHDRHSHGADAFRYFCEGYKLGYVGKELLYDEEESGGWGRSGGVALGAEWLRG